MSGFFGAILNDGSLLGGIVLLLAPLLVAAGVALAIIGARGRFRSTRASCRGCGFDLSGSMCLPVSKPASSLAQADASVAALPNVAASELATAPAPGSSPSPTSGPSAVRIGPELSSLFPPKCPECGVTLARPGAILPGELRRRPFMFSSGVVMALLGCTPIIWAGAQSLTLVNWNHYRTISALLSAAESGDTVATRELQNRCAGGLKDNALTSEVLRIYSKLLSTIATIESTPGASATAAASLAQLAAIDGLLTSLANSGQISSQQYVDLLPLVAPVQDWKIASTTAHRSSGWLNSQVSASPRTVGTMFGSRFQAQVKPTKIVAVDAEGLEYDLSSVGGMAYFYPQNGGNGALGIRHRLKPGPYTIKSDFRRTFTSLSPAYTDTFSAQGALLVIGDSDITVTVRTDRDTGQAIVDRLKIHEIGIVTGYSNDKQIGLMFTAAGLPSDWSFIAIIQQGNRKYTLGPIAVPRENTGVLTVLSSTDLLFGSLKGFTDEPVDLILKPGGRKHPWNKTTVDLWQGTITIPNLKVAKPRAYDDWPQIDTVPPTFFDRASVVVQTDTEKPPEIPAEVEK